MKIGYISFETILDFFLYICNNNKLVTAFVALIICQLLNQNFSIKTIKV